MSLRWRDECGVALAPTAAKWARWARGFARRPVQREVLPVAMGASGPAWRAPLAAWQAAWADKADGPRRPCDVRVLLSNHFVRYAVVPWHPQLTRRDERLALAEHAFRAAYGDLAAAWQVQLAPTGHGQPALACAVDRELVEAIREQCKSGGHRLVALQPLLMTVFNEYVGELGRDACLFVFEPGRLCCAWMRGGRWGAVRNIRLASVPVEALFERERQALGANRMRAVEDRGAADGWEPPASKSVHGQIDRPAVWRTDESAADHELGCWEAIRYMRQGNVVIQAMFDRERELLGVPGGVPQYVCDAGLGLPKPSKKPTYGRLPPPKSGRGDPSFALFAGAV